MSNLFIRWRHSKGYGIHSPFAYRFVTEVLRPGAYGYYAYWEAENLLRGAERNDYKFQNLIRFIIRLAIFLKAKAIFGEGDMSRLSEICSKALDLRTTNSPDPAVKSSDEERSLLILRGTADLSQLKDSLKSNTAILAIRPDEALRKFMEKPLERGLLLNDKKMMILIPRDEMAYIAYDMKMGF